MNQPGMTPAEFKSLREGLGLSAQVMAEVLGIRNERTIRHWEAGAPIPADAAERATAIDHLVWQMARHGHGVFKEHPAEVLVVLRYETAEIYGRYHPGDDRPHMHRLHAAAINRLRWLLQEDGRSLRILSMDEGSYEPWRKQAGLEDNETTRAAWAAEALSRLGEVAP